MVDVTYPQKLNFFQWFQNIGIFSVGTPICQDHFGWTADEIVSKFGIIMSVNGGLAFLCFFIIAPLARRSVAEIRDKNN